MDPAATPQVSGTPSERGGQKNLRRLKPSSLQRWSHKEPTDRSFLFKPTNPAFVQGRSIFPKSVVDAELSPRILVWGHNSSKIGGKILKGPWAGRTIYTITLEERATCPRSCQQWNTCYGNNMHWARRHRDDGWLMTMIWEELKVLSHKHRKKGFAVRLHVLGDFYSEEYVKFWQLALQEFPLMNVFGFTAHSRNSPIGEAIHVLNADKSRCSIRFSNDPLPGGALVIEDERDSRHILCPAQLGKTLSCGTCGLCWGTDKVIEFLRH